MGSLDSTVGRLVMSFVLQRPSEIQQCMPCIGPPVTRWHHKSTLFPRTTPGFCECDGRGYCAHTSDLGAMRSSRCTCLANCLDMPEKMWKLYAWQVLRVLLNHTRRG